MALNPAGLSLLIETVQIAEELILDAEELSASRRKVAPSVETKRVGPRRPVERLGGGRSPVDHDWFLGSVPHADAPDVERVTKAIGGVVDTTKYQRGIADIELRQPVDHVLGERFALETRLVGAASTDLEIRGEFSREFARLFERSVRLVEI